MVDVAGVDVSVTLVEVDVMLVVVLGNRGSGCRGSFYCAGGRAGNRGSGCERWKFLLR